MQHLTLCLLYSEQLDGARLFIHVIARIPSMFMPQSVPSTVNVILGIQCRNTKHDEWLRGAQISSFE